MFRYFTLEDFDFTEKVVGVRVDINSPIIDNKVVLNERIIAHSKTLKELSSRGAKVVVLAHQGRKGKDNCISLKEHSKLLAEQIGKDVKFIPEIFSKTVKEKIKELKPGQILLLENLRFVDDETDFEKHNNIIIELEKLFDYYVNDAFSVSHRKQTSLVDNSVVGFKKIPMIAGKTMEQELRGLNDLQTTAKPSVYVFGGAKPDDLVSLLEINLKEKKVDYVLLTGVIGEIALLTQGYYLGKKEQFLKDNGFLTCQDKIKTLLEKYKDAFFLPKDVALLNGKQRVEISIEKLKDKENRTLLDKYIIEDVGEKTVGYFATFLKGSGSIYFKGPAGNFEKKGMEYGTKGIIKAIVQSGSFTYMGGGHSVTAAEEFKMLKDFSYVSLAGGALVKFLSGQSLPGVEALERSFDMHEKQYEDFLVVGSNTLDIGVEVPINFSDFYLGDKVRIEDDFKTNVGGGGINVSICIRRLGGKVGYLGKLSFENQDKINEVLSKNKVDLVPSKLSKRPCAKSVILDTKDNDRIIFTYRGQNAYLEEQDFEFGKINANNFYFSSLSGTSFNTLVSLAKKIRTRNENSLICLNLTSHLIRNERYLKDLVRQSDVVVLNLEEAEEFTGKTRISDCFKEIKSLSRKLVVITDAQNGAFAYDGKREYHVNSEHVKKVIDATGAGDSFAGTFFYFYSKGYGIQKALKYAAKNSANVICYKGAQEGLMYYEDLIKK